MISIVLIRFSTR